MVDKNNALNCIEIDPNTAAEHSIIWLHGLGADGHDFVPFVSEIHLPETLHVRFIFPHAPMMPITINSGYVMRAWYDIKSLHLNDHIDQQSIESSVILVRQLIAKEVAKGIATENIMLGGFSQGAVIALLTGLTHPDRLGGLIALSGYLPITGNTNEAYLANLNTPIFLAHGTHDTIVPYALGKAAYVLLKEKGYPITWQSYPIGHSASWDEIQAIRQWILQIWVR